eukprot:751054-Hanusia_phi.AAC.2
MALVYTFSITKTTKLNECSKSVACTRSHHRCTSFMAQGQFNVDSGNVSVKVPFNNSCSSSDENIIPPSSRDPFAALTPSTQARTRARDLSTVQDSEVGKSEVSSMREWVRRCGPGRYSRRRVADTRQKGGSNACSLQTEYKRMERTAKSFYFVSFFAIPLRVENSAQFPRIMRSTWASLLSAILLTFPSSSSSSSSSSSPVCFQSNLYPRLSPREHSVRWGRRR